MYRKIIDKLSKYNNIAILGYGREGISTYNFIRKYLKNIKITILDEVNKEVNDNNTYFKKYNRNIEDLLEFDLIIKTPGISLKDIDINLIKDRITSQLELLLEVNRDNMIGITGTKGKSTTSSLLYKVLNDYGKKVFLVGNIGFPVLDQIEEYNDAIIITEMSSHQLEFLNVSPKIGIVLNLFQDHLDHAGSVKHYHDCKMNMFKYQIDGDYSLYNIDNKYIKDYISNNDYKGIKYEISNCGNGNVNLINGDIFINDKFIINDKDIKRNILGEHNLLNIMFVLSVCDIFKIDISKIWNSISEFVGLEHRMEFVCCKEDISFYNDSIATIPEAVINACKTIGNVDTLIFGGQDRGISYDEFIEFLDNSNISNLICMPSTGFNIADKLKNKRNIIKVNTLEEAVEEAFNVTKKGYSCLLSPAAPSYEFFKNFEEKGKRYKELINNR